MDRHCLEIVNDATKVLRKLSYLMEKLKIRVQFLFICRVRKINGKKI